MAPMVDLQVSPKSKFTPLRSLRGMLLAVCDAKCSIPENGIAGYMNSEELGTSTGGPHVGVPIYTMGVQLNPMLPREGELGKATVELELETFEDVISPTGSLTVSIGDRQIFAGRLSAGQKGVTSDGSRTRFVYQSPDLNFTEPGIAVLLVKFDGVPPIEAQVLVLEAGH